MSPKETLTVSLTCHPAGGVLQPTVSKILKWVSELSNLDKAMAVLEPNKREGKHLHVGLQFSALVKSANLKKRLMTLLKEEFQNPDLWGSAAIVCHAHHDFKGLVGGYFDKDSDVEKVLNINVDTETLKEGKVIYEAAQANHKKLRIGPTTIIPLLIQTHANMKDWDEILLIDGEAVDYEAATAKQQFDACLRHIVSDGYFNVLTFIGKLKSEIVLHWNEIHSSRNRNVIISPPPI